MNQGWGSLGSAFAPSSLDGHAALGQPLGAWGLPKDALKAQRKCDEAKAKLAALRAKRGAKGKGENWKIRDLEGKVAKLCTYANKLATTPSYQDEVAFDALMADFDADVGAQLAAEGGDVGPISMGPGMSPNIGGAGIPTPVLIIGGLLVVGAVGVVLLAPKRKRKR